MKEKELQQLVDELWKRMEPLARAELERLFTNYMSTRTLLEPELVKKLFDAMQKDLQKFMQRHFDRRFEALRAKSSEERKEWWIK